MQPFNLYAPSCIVGMTSRTPPWLKSKKWLSRICVVCKKTYKTRCLKRKTCSESCKHENRSNWSHQKLQKMANTWRKTTCEACGDPFKFKSSAQKVKYCSSKCKQDVIKIKRECQIMLQQAIGNSFMRKRA